MSLCGRHTVQVAGGAGGAGGTVRRQLQPHTGASQSPPHTPKIAIPQLRGDYAGFLNSTGQGQ